MTKNIAELQVDSRALLKKQRGQYKMTNNSIELIELDLKKFQKQYDGLDTKNITKVYARKLHNTPNLDKLYDIYDYDIMVRIGDSPDVVELASRELTAKRVEEMRISW